MSDLIDRQAAIDAVIEITYDQTALHHGWVDPYYVINRLEYLPTAEKRGEWISHEGYEECSQCGKFTVCYSKFCPNCGARMEN